MKMNCNIHALFRPSSMNSTTHQSNGNDVTIVFNGRLCVCDATEIQARAIIWVARREMEERLRTAGMDKSATTSLQPQFCSLPGVSLKRSLQRFLQKRKARIQATSPYKH